MTFDIPLLHTARLTLRAFEQRDHPPYAAMERDPAVVEYRGGNILNENQAWTAMQLLLGQWALRRYGVFAVEATESGLFLGFAGILHPAEWPEPELAYSLARPYWGQGLASEAAAAARDWAFRTLQVASLASFILPDNERSKRVAARLGAVRSGLISLRGHETERWLHSAPSATAVAS